MNGSVVRRGLLPTVLWMAVAAPLWSQDAAAGAKPLKYETVSIKPNKPDGDGMMRVRMQVIPGSYSANGVTVKTLIQSAYNLKMPDQISGVPKVMDDARFDIEAKMDAETVEALKKLSMDTQAEQRRLMMQAVLADRFKLKVHQESKELPVFALTVAKGGPKLKEGDPNNPPANGIKGPDGMVHGGVMMMRPGSITAQGVPISNLVSQLAGQLHRTVMDKTGLTGKYDISLTWTPDENGADGAASADSGPSIFTAVQEQLGLKLESTKGMVETVVVDHLEMPSEN